MSVLFNLTTMSTTSLEWDYNDNPTQNLDFNNSTMRGSAAKRLFSWEYDLEDQSTNKFPRLNLTTNATKVYTLQHEYENFAQILSKNRELFKLQSEQLQVPVDHHRPGKKVLNALSIYDKQDSEKKKLENIINRSEVKLVKIGEDKRKIMTEINNIEEKFQTLKITKVTREANLDKYKNIVENEEDFIKNAKMKISIEVSLLEKYVGLQLINSTHNSIIFVFTNIIRDKPRERFCFELLLSNRSYRVTNCQPYVAKMDDMVKFLNKSDDLSGFVSQVRMKFVALTT